MALAKTDVSLDDTAVAAGTAKGAVASGAIAVGLGIDGVMRIANGATGPNAGAKCAVQARPPGSANAAHWRDLFVFQAGTAASGSDGVYDFSFHVEPGIGEIRFIAWDNTAQAVTFSVRAGRVDSY